MGLISGSKWVQQSAVYTARSMYLRNIKRTTDKKLFCNSINFLLMLLIFLFAFVTFYLTGHDGVRPKSKQDKQGVSTNTYLQLPPAQRDVRRERLQKGKKASQNICIEFHFIVPVTRRR